jgi:hypothetical protein
MNNKFNDSNRMFSLTTFNTYSFWASIVAALLLSVHTVVAAEHVEIPISVSCISTGQVCAPSGHARLTLPNDSTVSAYFWAGGPCSSINVVITGPLSGTTGWTNVEAATKYYLGTKNLSKGTYDFYATATGTIGGCNYNRGHL